MKRQQPDLALECFLSTGPELAAGMWQCWGICVGRRVSLCLWEALKIFGHSGLVTYSRIRSKGYHPLSCAGTLLSSGAMTRALKLGFCGLTRYEGR